MVARDAIFRHPRMILRVTRGVMVRLYAFPDGIYIVEGHGEHKDLAGSRVLAFGGMPAEEALRRLAEATSVAGRGSRRSRKRRAIKEHDELRDLQPLSAPLQHSPSGTCCG